MGVDIIGTRMARAMKENHPSLADPDIFENTLSWSEFADRRDYSEQERKEFMSAYRREYKRCK